MFTLLLLATGIPFARFSFPCIIGIMLLMALFSCAHSLSQPFHPHLANIANNAAVKKLSMYGMRNDKPQELTAVARE